jgi:hypothetical protein
MGLCALRINANTILFGICNAVCHHAVFEISEDSMAYLVDAKNTHVAFIPCAVTNKLVIEPLSQHAAIELDGGGAHLFVTFLKSSWSNKIERDYQLQCTSQRLDGTKLLSAFVPIADFVSMLSDAGAFMAGVLSKAKEWELGCRDAVVIVDFERA